MSRLGEEEFTQLYDELYERSFRHARVILRNDHDAEDAASKAWLELYTRWPDSGRDRTAVVLRRVGMRSLDILRQRVRRPFADGDVADVASSSTGVDLSDEMVLDDCLQRLPPEDLAMIWLSRAEGVNDSEVGRRLGRHRTTVSGRTPITLATLRECMEGAAS